MDLKFAGKRAVIIGGTRGIGRATVETLANNGAQVAFCARNSQQIEDMAKQLQEKSINVFARTVDVADGSALKSWIVDAGQILGGIDVLIHNPSAFAMGNTEEDWMHGFQVDMLGAVRSVEAANPFLEKAALKTGDASIVILSSAAAAETDYEYAYGAIKSALIHFTKGVARRLASKHIRANSVSPGTVFFSDGFWDKMKRDAPDIYESYLKRNPMGRMATPQEIANVITFLASSSASFVTGANIIVDGAFTNRVNF